MKFALTSLAAVSALALMAGVAQAQVSTQVTQTATPANASTFLQGQAGASACSTVNTTTANGTVTITPPAGLYVYITGVYIDITADATGTTSVATMSTTNLTGGPIWSLATIVPTANSVGQFRQIAETYATPFKSRTPGTAVTFVPSAQIADTIVCVRVAGYFAQ